MCKMVDRILAHASALEDDPRAEEAVVGWATLLATMPPGLERERVAANLERTLLAPAQSDWDAMAMLRRFGLDRDSPDSSGDTS